MNVVDKFISNLKTKSKKCIILLSGFDILHLDKYAKLLATNINFELIDFKYPDFDTLNNNINDSNSTGIIVFGLTFPMDKLKFKPFYHLSISANRSLIVDENKFNIYQDNIKNNLINKFKNMKDILYHEELYLDIFNIIIELIMKNVYGDRYEEAQKAYIKSLSENESSVESNNESNNDLSEKSEFNTEYNEYNIPKRNLLKEELDDIKKNEAETLKAETLEAETLKAETLKADTIETSNKRIIGTRILKSKVPSDNKMKNYKVGGLVISSKENTSSFSLIGTRSLTNILKF